MEQARLALEEALRVVRVGELQQLVVEMVHELVEERPQERLEGHHAPLLGRAHPELDLRHAAAVAGVEAMQLGVAQRGPHRQDLDARRRHVQHLPDAAAEVLHGGLHVLSPIGGERLAERGDEGP